MINKYKLKNILILEFSFFIYSLSSLFSKMAMYDNPTTFHIIFFYGLSLMMLGIYAIIWQQVLKRMKLTVAFSNKGITIIWGLIFGTIFFREKISLGMIIGSAIVILGIIVMMKEKENTDV